MTRPNNQNNFVATNMRKSATIFYKRNNGLIMGIMYE
jgi:hypothetical protein